RGSKKVAPSTAQSAKPSTSTLLTTAEAGAEDLQESYKQLSARLDHLVEKQHGEQRSIFIGVLLALVLIVVSVAAEVVIFNAAFRDSLDQYTNQERQDYKSLRDSIDQNQNNVTQQLLNIKLNQPAQ